MILIFILFCFYFFDQYRRFSAETRDMEFAFRLENLRQKMMLDAISGYCDSNSGIFKFLQTKIDKTGKSISIVNFFVYMLPLFFRKRLVDQYQWFINIIEEDAGCYYAQIYDEYCLILNEYLKIKYPLLSFSVQGDSKCLYKMSLLAIGEYIWSPI